MNILINFFFKVLAFFLAITTFIIILIIIINLSQNRLNTEKFNFKEGNIDSNNKIVLLKLRGPIFNEPSNSMNIGFFNDLEIIYVNEIKKILKDLENKNIKGVIVSIDSPGGSVSATYNLYNAINNYKKNNNITIYFHTNELLVSGGYWAALASDKIFANYGSLVGSIGVRGPDWIYYDNPVSISEGILGQTIETKKGIKIFKNIAGKSKDLFDSFRMPTDTELLSLQKIVNSIYDDFVLVVSKNRNIEKEIIINDIGALIFNAKEAKKNYLIDDVLDIDKAIEALVKKLELKDYQIIERKKNKLTFLQQLTSVNFKNYNYFITKNKVEICNLLKESVSVIFVQKNYFENC